MRRHITVVVLVVCWFLAAQESRPTTIEGLWVGQWVRDGAQLEVSMRFSRDRAGYTGYPDAVVDWASRATLP